MLRSFHLAARRLFALALLSGAAGFGLSQINVTTYHNDMYRTGLNPHEAILTPTTVNASSFGLLSTLPVDGQIYAQPLVLSRITVQGKVRNVVYVCTEHNSVYAFDAKVGGAPLWQVNLGPSVPAGDTGAGDIWPEIGITGTPVIFGTVPNEYLYVVAKTKEQDANGNPIYVQRLHALDVTTGSEALGGPVVIQGTVNGVGDGNDGHGHVPFNPKIQHNRAALLEVTNGGQNTLYIGFASHGDNGPYHGWIFAYDANTLKQLAIFNTTPNALTDPSGYPIAAGGVWQAGGGLASDGSNIFFSTGNGTFDPSTHAYGDAILRMHLIGSALSVRDYFAPHDQQNLDDTDMDLGSGGVMLLPAQMGSTAIPQLMVQCGKEGSIYLMNRRNLGKFSSATDNVVQELGQVIGGIWGNPACWANSIYFGPVGGQLCCYQVQNAAFTSNNPVSTTPEFFGYPGPTPCVSSHFLSNPIVWAVQADGNSASGQAVLHAYDATNLSNELYNSGNTGGRDTLGPAVKFVSATVADGQVFVGTGNSLAVFGLGQWAATPAIAPASGNYQNSVTVTVTDSTPKASIYYTTDGSVPTQSSTPYTGPVTFTTSTTFTARAFAPGYGASAYSQAFYQINAVIGNGKGLLGKYYNNTQNPTGPPTITRIDPTINFNWNGGSPMSGVAGTNWAAEWVGNIQAETTSTYTFYTLSDDGVRVWVNGVEIINDWTYHGPTWDVGTITLNAGQKYTITIDYFQGGGGSVLQFYWAAPGMPAQIVPQSQLYPNGLL